MSSPNFVIESVDKSLIPFKVSYYNTTDPTKLAVIELTAADVMEAFAESGVTVEQLDSLKTEPLKAVPILRQLAESLARWPEQKTTEEGELPDPGPKYLIPNALIIDILTYSAEAWIDLKN